MKKRNMFSGLLLILVMGCFMIGSGCKREPESGTHIDQPLEDLVLYESFKFRHEYQLKKAISISDIFEIPETYNNDPVTTIGEFAFANLTNVKEIKLPSSIKVIERGAFMGCSNLEKINIPSSVEIIKNDAFYLCDKLNYRFVDDVQYLDNWLVRAVDLTKSEYNIKKTTMGILEEAFKDCEAMNKITIPESVQFIGDFAFDTTAITSLSLGENLKHMGSNIVYGCTALREIIISEKNAAFEVIDDVVYSKATFRNSFKKDLYIYPRYNNRYNYEVVIGTRAIMPYAFENTLVETVTLPETLTIISEGAFFKANHLTTLAINTAIKEIGVRAFYGCNDLSSALFPNGLKSIGDEAFYECSNLVMVSLPATLETIGKNILKKCQKIRELSIPYLINEHNESIIPILFESNLNIPQTIEKLDILGGTAIDKENLGFFQNLENISISETISTIEEGVFNLFKGLTAVRVDINNQVYRSDNGVLYTKDGTEIIYYPIAKQDATYTLLNTTKVIRTNAFKDTIGTIRVIIPDGVTTIQTEAFVDSEALKTINIPSSVINISQNAFNRLPNVVIDVDLEVSPVTWSNKWYGNLKNAAQDPTINERDNQIIWN